MQTKEELTEWVNRIVSGEKPKPELIERIKSLMLKKKVVLNHCLQEQFPDVDIVQICLAFASLVGSGFMQRMYVLEMKDGTFKVHNDLLDVSEEEGKQSVNTFIVFKKD